MTKTLNILCYRQVALEDSMGGISYTKVKNKPHSLGLRRKRGVKISIAACSGLS